MRTATQLREDILEIELRLVAPLPRAARAGLVNELGLLRAMLKLRCAIDAKTSAS